ncbi:MAG: autotransporter domain-containing protein [Rhizobiaceae bacterium]
MTTQQTVGTGGVGLIEALGALNVAVGDAVTFAGNDVTVNNAGTITALGGAADGIAVNNSSTVINSGTINATRDAINIFAGNTVINYGTLTSRTGIFAAVGGDGNTIFNYGTINSTCCGISLYDDNVITNTGTIISTTSDAINVVDNNWIFNSGTLEGAGDGIFAVDNNKVTNSGTITAGDDGIYLEDNNTVINSGTISSTNDGIEANDNNKVTNSGTITAGEDGINLDNNNTVINSGTITATDDGIDLKANSTITNTGTIKSTGDDGIDIEGSGTTLTNSGTIIGFEAAVDSDSSNTTVINSGSVINSQGPAGFAYEFTGGAGDRLVFLDSPLTIGRIFLDDDTGGVGDIVEFQVAGGRSLDVTFEPLPGTLIHDASIQSTVVKHSENRVVYVDPTGFLANAVWLDGLARSIFDAVNGANSGNAPDNSSNAYFLQTGDASATSNARPYRVWASGFANISRQMASGTNGELTTANGGAVFGMDADLSAQTNAGLFGGVSRGRMMVENNRQSIFTNAGYLGAYASWTDNDYFGNFIAFGGLSEQDSKRDVANNLVVGGIEQARSKYSAAFISPALTIGKQVAELPDGRPLLGSIRLHYAGMWIGGNSETGVTNPVSADSRAIHRLGARAQISFPENLLGADGSSIRVDRRMGVDYGFSANSQKVKGSVAGLPLNFDADFDNQGPAGFFGADFTRVLEGGDRILKAGTEVRLATDGSIEMRAQLTFKSFF